MNVLNNIRRKQADHDRMSSEMVKVMSEIAKAELFGQQRKKEDYIPKIDMELPEWLPF